MLIPAKYKDGGSKKNGWFQQNPRMMVGKKIRWFQQKNQTVVAKKDASSSKKQSQW